MEDLRTLLTPKQTELVEACMEDARVLKEIVRRLNGNQRKIAKIKKYNPAEAMMLKWLEEEGDEIIRVRKMIDTQEYYERFRKFSAALDPDLDVNPPAFGVWIKKLRPQLIRMRKYANFTRRTLYMARWQSPTEIERAMIAGELKGKPTDRQLVKAAEAARAIKEKARYQAEVQSRQEKRAERNEKRKIQQREAAAKARQAPSPNDIFGDLL